MMAGGILGWIIIGGLAGWVASIIKGKNASMGIGANILAGIVGAFIGGFILSLLGIDAGSGLIISFISATIGAVILLTIINMIKR